MEQILLVLGIASGGAAGAVTRYLVSTWANRMCGEAFPSGTLVVNVLGCLLLGVLSHTAPAAQFLSPAARTIVAAGFLGALTTFSTFGAETIDRLARGQVFVGCLNVGANVCCGLLAVWIGATLARALLGEP